MVERAGQLPFTGLEAELVIDLESGEKKLRLKKPRKSAPRSVRRPVPTRQWWERIGSMAFSNAAEGWKVSRAARMAEEFGQNVEFAGAQMSGAETEELLRRAFRTARSSGIGTLPIVEMMKAESFRLEQKLGNEGSWLPPFVDCAIDVLAKVYRMRSANREALKMFAHQRDLSV